VDAKSNSSRLSAKLVAVLLGLTCMASTTPSVALCCKSLIKTCSACIGPNMPNNWVACTGSNCSEGCTTASLGGVGQCRCPGQRTLLSGNVREVGQTTGRGTTNYENLNRPVTCVELRTCGASCNNLGSCLENMDDDFGGPLITYRSCEQWGLTGGSCEG